MEKSTKYKTNPETGEITFSAFGSITEATILNSKIEIRNICNALSQWQIGSGEGMGKTIKIIIISYEEFWGSFSKGKPTDWKQITFVPAPSDPSLNKHTFPNLTYITHIKTGSLRAFDILIYSLIAQGKNPSEGTTTGTLAPRQNDLGSYSEIEWSWEPIKEEELSYFLKVDQFLKTRPDLKQDTCETMGWIPRGSTKEQIEDIQASTQEKIKIRKAQANK